MTRIKETEAKPSPGAYRQSLTALLIRIRQQNGQPDLFCTKTPSSGLQRHQTQALPISCVSISPVETCLYIFTNGEKEIILINLLIQIRDYSGVFREKSCFLRECQCLIMYNEASVTPFCICIRF